MVFNMLIPPPMRGENDKQITGKQALVCAALALLAVIAALYIA